MFRESTQLSKRLLMHEDPFTARFADA